MQMLMVSGSRSFLLSGCEACGAEITYKRLLARPVATQCIDCKTEAEQIESRRRVF